MSSFASKLKQVFSAQRWGALSCALLLVGCLMGRAADTVRVTVQLGSDKDGLFLKQGDMVFHLTPNEQLGAPPLSLAGSSLHVGADGKSVEFQSGQGELVVEAGFLSGMAFKISPGSTVQTVIDPADGKIQWAVGGGKTAGVVVRMPDGAAVSIPAGSEADLAYFADQTYYLTGKGGAEYEGADGSLAKLMDNLPPRFGGPLQTTHDKNGLARLERLTPLRNLTIGGQLPGGPITVTLDGETHQVENGKPLDLHTASGGEIQFSLDPATHQLHWSVVSGCFQIGIQGISGWNALAMPGSQSGAQWDAANLLVDFSNLTPPGASGNTGIEYVLLREGTLAVVYPKATFQFAAVRNSTSFATAAVGGKVFLHRANSSQSVALDPSNHLFSGSGGWDDNRYKMSLAWQCGSPMEMTGARSKTSIPVDSSRKVPIPDVGEVDLTYTSDGFVNMKAKEGQYTFNLKQMPGWSFAVDEGDAVTFQLDCRKNMITVTADAANANPVSVNSAAGFSPELAPGSSLTFVLGSTPTLTDTGGTFVFYEAAGAAGDQAFGVAPPASSGTIDDSRVYQPPVSVVR